MSTTIYETTKSLAQRAQINRGVIMRLLAAGHLAADAWVVEGTDRAALFFPERAIDVLRLQKRLGRRAPLPSAQ